MLVEGDLTDKWFCGVVGLWTGEDYCVFLFDLFRGGVREFKYIVVIVG